jgi:hypothetical protein
MDEGVRRWRFARRWARVAVPSDALTALAIDHELKAIVDRRAWESPEAAARVDVADGRPATAPPSPRAA